MKLKAPQVTRESLVGLKTLIRFNFAREVRKAVESAATELPAATTLKILMLSEAANEADQPLAIAMAMIDMTGAPNAWLPLNEDKFAMYMRIIGLEVSESDFGALPADLSLKARTLLSSIQVELKKDFDAAGMIDPQEMMRGPGAPSLGAKPPASGMMN